MINPTVTGHREGIVALKMHAVSYKKDTVVSVQEHILCLTATDCTMMPAVGNNHTTQTLTLTLYLVESQNKDSS